MIVKTDGVILRILPYSRTSLMADCLTRELGRIWLLAKGAYRPRSIFMGQIDLFYTCEVLVYQRASRVLVLKECAALATRDLFRSDWRAAACASYFCDFTSQVTPPCIPHDDLFALLEDALDALLAKGASPSLMGWYELAALKALGLGPALARCPACGKDQAGGGPLRLKVSARMGGVLCRKCEDREPGPGIGISAGTLALLRAWDLADEPALAATTVPSQLQWSEIQAVLKVFSSYHLEVGLRSRDITLDLLRRVVSDQ
jgi:DNA repair protein RecO (recombination protein O)